MTTVRKIQNFRNLLSQNGCKSDSFYEILKYNGGTYHETTIITPFYYSDRDILSVVLRL